MKKILYLTALAIASGIAFTGCEDYLEAENKTAGGKTADMYFSTAEGQMAYRDYAVSLLRPLANTDFIELYDEATDLYWPNRNQPVSYAYYSITTIDETVKNFYLKAYALINAANGVVFYGGYDSDAKFLRSYGYYMLTQQFGSVPYVTWYVNDANRNYPRTPLKEIYDGCLADLDAVIADPNIPETSAHDGVINKQGAKALAAKIALAAGWDLQTEMTNAAKGTYNVSGKDYFNRAAAYAEAALSGVALYSNFADKWSAANDETNQEEFFSVEYDRASVAGVTDPSENGHSLQNEYSSYYGDGKSDGVKAGMSQRGISQKALYLFEKGDTRYAATFAIIHPNFDKETKTWPGTGYYSKYVLEDPASVGIHLYFAPWYTTKTEFKQFLNDNKSRFVLGDYKNAPIATLLGDPATVVKFKPDGSIASETSMAFHPDYLLKSNNGCDCVCKWDDPQTDMLQNRKNCYRDIPILHATETMATAAEAYLLAGEEGKALAYVNKLRTRAGLTALSSFSAYDPYYLEGASADIDLTPLDCVLDERARELYGEPGRWMDLRRTKQLERYYTAFSLTNKNIQAAAQAVKWLRPIPFDEINNNEAISTADQNPGY